MHVHSTEKEEEKQFKMIKNKRHQVRGREKKIEIEKETETDREDSLTKIMTEERCTWGKNTNQNYIKNRSKCLP